MIYNKSLNIVYCKNKRGFNVEIKYTINNVYDDLTELDKEDNFNSKLLKIIYISKQLEDDHEIY